MAKCCRVTSLVALALLGCLVGTEVKAQGSAWSAPSTKKGAPPPPPQVLPHPQVPQVQPPPPPPQKAPPYPQVPQVQPPPPPQKAPPYPQVPQVMPPRKVNVYQQGPKVQPPPAPNVPQYQPPVAQPAPPPKYPQYQPPVAQPAAPPKYPQYQPPVAQPAAPPKYPHYQPPVAQPAPPPKYPQYQPPVAQPAAPPKYPQAFHDQEPQDPPPQQPQRPQVHAVPQTQSASSVGNQPPVQSCEVQTNVRISCGASDISAAGCEAISCCFDGRQCYFGKAVTVQATKDGQFIVVVARDATLPNIDLESISLLGQGQGCTHVDSNSEFAIYQFPVTACGSIVMEEPGVIIYENRMVSSYEVGVGRLGVITRDSYFELLFQSRYTGTSVETVVVEVLPLDNPPLPVAALGPIRVHMRLANGQCNTKGCNEVEVAYSSFYTDADYPVTKVLRDPVYVEVQLLEKTDPNLVLTLGRCWTTTSSNPHSLPQWDILTDGCPYRDDRYLSSLVPVGLSSGLDFPSHYRRFIFKMFTFVDTNSMEPMKEQVYIHCSTAVCTAAAGHSCEPSCYRRKRDVKDVDQKKAEPKVVVSSGPVIMSSPQQ
ncbi:hypothetical protein ABVT39_028299 [Epinephelus coioides]